MTLHTRSPAAGSAAGLDKKRRFLGRNDDAPEIAPSQAEILREAERRHLRLVPRPPQPRREVRISVLDGRSPIGRAGPFRITESDANELIALAARMDRRA